MNFKKVEQKEKSKRKEPIKHAHKKYLSWSTKKPHVIANIRGSVTVLYNPAGIL
jgi:metal-responsive CopG/Arc/MetJ family transcriptional regulator